MKKPIPVIARDICGYIFWGLNIAKVLVGVLLTVHGGSMLRLHVTPVLICQILIGAHIGVMGILGCMGIKKRSIKFLNQYSYQVFYSTVILLIYACVLVTTQNVLKNLMTKLYSELFKNRHVSPIYTEIIEYVESTFNCCGVDGSDDYFTSKYNTIWEMLKTFFGIPTLNSMYCNYQGPHEHGCIKMLIKATKSYIFYFCLLVTSIEALSLVLSNVVIRQIQKPWSVPKSASVPIRESESIVTL